jgi:hypothetical protein
MRFQKGFISTKSEQAGLYGIENKNAKNCTLFWQNNKN